MGILLGKRFAAIMKIIILFSIFLIKVFDISGNLTILVVIYQVRKVNG